MLCVDYSRQDNPRNTRPKPTDLGILGPNFRRFWVKFTVLAYYVTKKWLFDIA